MSNVQAIKKTRDHLLVADKRSEDFIRLRQEFIIGFHKYFSNPYLTLSTDPWGDVKTLHKEGVFSVDEIIDFSLVALGEAVVTNQEWIRALECFVTLYPVDADTAEKNRVALSLKRFLRSVLVKPEQNFINLLFMCDQDLFEKDAFSSREVGSLHEVIYNVFAPYKDFVCESICSIHSSTHKADIIERALSKKDPLGELFWRSRGIKQASLQAGTLARLCAAYEPRKSTRYQQPEAYSDSLLQSASTGDMETLRAQLSSVSREKICLAMFVAIRNPDQGQSLEVLRALFNELKRFPEWVKARNSVADESRNTLLMQAVLFQNQPAIDYLLSESTFDPGYENNDGHTIFDVAEIALYGGPLRALKARLDYTLRPPSSSDEAYEFVANVNQQALAWNSFSFTGSLYSLFCRADNQPPEAVDRDVDSDEDSSSHGL